MPKLRKEIENKVKDMIRNDYINAEIQSLTSVSLPTIRKLRKQVKSEKNLKNGKESKTLTVGEGKYRETVKLVKLNGKMIPCTNIIDVETARVMDDIESYTLDKIISDMWRAIEELQFAVYAKKG